MKYSGADFKFTSQANHLAKLLTLLAECQRQSHHMQRLYKRRRTNSDGMIESNWDVVGYGVYYDVRGKQNKYKSGSGSSSDSDDYDEVVYDGGEVH
jgi:hypothetical protein